MQVADLHALKATIDASMPEDREASGGCGWNASRGLAGGGL